MKTRVTALMLLAAAACSPQGDQKAQAPAATTQTATVTPTTPATPQAPAIDPAAIQALQKMGAYLRTLQNFEIRTRTNQDEVLVDTGQKVQFAGNGLYRIRRPNAFYLEVNTDRKQRRLYYDGQSFTIYSPRMHVYARRDAPPTIGEAVDEMRDRYNIPVPLADLFYWGTDEGQPTVQLASVIGFARMGDQTADQYAFREGDLDWQVWIARGNRPLPLKVVITTRSQPEQPQFVTELSWNLSPRFSDATFAFHPPKDAHEIGISESS